MVFILGALAAVSSFALSPVLDLPLTYEIMSRMDPNTVFVLMAVLLAFATMIALLEGISEGIAGSPSQPHASLRRWLLGYPLRSFLKG